MKHQANHPAAEREAQGSSVQSVQMKVRIPKDIQAPNHRRAYAMAYRAGYRKQPLRFVSGIVRFSIARGWTDGERAYWADVDAEIEEMLAEETAARA